MSFESGPNHTARLWLYTFAGVVFFFLIVPVFIVIPMSFSGSRFLTFPPASWSLQWYESYLQSIEWRAATIVSVRAALLTTVVATPIGLSAAYGLHGVRSGWAAALRALMLTPLITPIIILGVGIFYLYARLGVLNTTLGLVLAHSVLAVPLVTMTVEARLRRFDFAQELAAQGLGATRLRAFFLVTLPQIKSAVVAGALLSFITSLDEVVIALFITHGDGSTISRRIFTSLRDELDPTIAAISSLLLALSVILTAFLVLTNRRRRSADVRRTP